MGRKMVREVLLLGVNNYTQLQGCLGRKSNFHSHALAKEDYENMWLLVKKQTFTWSGREDKFDVCLSVCVCM